MVQAGEVVPQSFFTDAEDAQTLLNLAEKDDMNTFRLPITEKEDISPDTIRLRLQFPNPEWVSGLPICHHIKIFNEPTEEGVDPICRPYTPITAKNTRGHIDFVIKCYP